MTDEQIIGDRCPELAEIVEQTTQIREMSKSENTFIISWDEINAIRTAFLKEVREKERLEGQIERAESFILSWRHCFPETAEPEIKKISDGGNNHRSDM
jgi:hypothetical protein